MNINVLGIDIAKNSFQCVKPFVKTNKNDANDAQAIVEARGHFK